VQPNISLVNKTGIETADGILVDEHLETSISDVFAIGDCAEIRTPDPGRRAIEPVWYTGRKMGETVASTVLGKPEKYTPGLWFNSAKFFDLEYQVYGKVPNKPDKDSKQYYWEDKEKEQALRLVTDEQGKIIGLNALGLRLDQMTCEKWIKTALPVEKAIAQLEKINFNPEFSMKLSQQVNLELVP
jgi:NADPH-dependent 2,4-dienoyl-CoA reductase/sulfur reductase-like enzyme